MDDVTQGNASQTEELSGTAEGLAAQAVQLQQLVAQFNLIKRDRLPAKVQTRPAPVYTGAQASGGNEEETRSHKSDQA